METGYSYTVCAAHREQSEIGYSCTVCAAHREQSEIGYSCTVCAAHRERRETGYSCTVCAAHRERSETRHICKLYVVPLHKGSCFEKYHSVTKYYNIYRQFMQSGAREHNLQCQTDGSICYGIEHSKRLKCLGTGDI